MRMQLPLTAHKVYGAWVIEDATGATVAVLPVSGPDDKIVEADAHQFVQSANAYPVLVAACAGLDAALMTMEDLDQRTFDTVDDYLSENIIELRSALALTKATQ